MPLIDMSQMAHDLQTALHRAMDEQGKDIVNRIIAEAQRQVHVELMALSAGYALRVVELMSSDRSTREYRVTFEVRTPEDKP